jgi:hypothetical protein
MAARDHVRTDCRRESLIERGKFPDASGYGGTKANGSGRSIWRREWDSNPRYGFPHTRFPSVRLKPLGHLSGGPLLKGRENFCK